jgi:DNA-binding NtrC family response regulator
MASSNSPKHVTFPESGAVRLEESRTRREKFRMRRVLVVDDEPLIRWAASSALTDAGFTVLEASDAAGARRVVHRELVDLALLDVRLPDGDGVALMEEIRGAQPECRFIMMTAFRTPEVTACMAAGHVPVLDKPFDMPDLVACIGILLDS